MHHINVNNSKNSKNMDLIQLEIENRKEVCLCPFKVKINIKYDER